MGWRGLPVVGCPVASRRPTLGASGRRLAAGPGLPWPDPLELSPAGGLGGRAGAGGVVGSPCPAASRERGQPLTWVRRRAAGWWRWARGEGLAAPARGRSRRLGDRVARARRAGLCPIRPLAAAGLPGPPSWGRRAGGRGLPGRPLAGASPRRAGPGVDAGALGLLSWGLDRLEVPPRATRVGHRAGGPCRVGLLSRQRRWAAQPSPSRGPSRGRSGSGSARPPPAADQGLGGFGSRAPRLGGVVPSRGLAWW